MSPLPRLYTIADAGCGDPVALARELFAGGARLLQVRNKDGSSRELLQQVEAILAFAPVDAQVVVNDRVDIALLAKAHGVHLGQDDLPVEAARRLLGPQALIGFSTHSLEQIRAADSLPIDYLAVGPIFETQSKKNPDPVVGVEQLRELCRDVRKPVVAIGGISLGTAPSVFEAGAASVAVIRDLLSAPDIQARTKEWLQVIRVISG